MEMRRWLAWSEAHCGISREVGSGFRLAPSGLRIPVRDYRLELGQKVWDAQVHYKKTS